MKKELELSDENFTDVETIHLLEDIAFDEPYEFLRYKNGKGEVYHKNYFVPPADCCWLWQQIKEWLWKRHKIYVSHKIGNTAEEHCYVVYILSNENGILYKEIGISESFTSPGPAERQAIKNAIKYLHSKI